MELELLTSQDFLQLFSPRTLKTFYKPRRCELQTMERLQLVMCYTRRYEYVDIRDTIHEHSNCSSATI